MKKIQTRMLQSLALVVYSRLFLTVGSQTGQVLPPQNMSLLWVNDFEPELTWAPPPHSVANCTYKVLSKTNKKDSDFYSDLPPWKSFIVMEGGFLQVSVQTVCGGNRSEPTVLDVKYPEMVKNVQCSVLSSKKAHFSWETANRTAAVRFFYRLVEENLSTPVHDDSPSLQECPLYNYTEGAGTSCDLQVNLRQSILVLFNGTANKALFRNTFRWLLIKQVKPPPLRWTVKKTGKIFLISWIPTDIKSLFEKYIINYTECNQIKIKTITDVEETSAELDLLSQCPYRIAMKAQYEEFNSPWGGVEHFDADTDPNDWVYAAVIIPLMVAALASLTFVCCSKNKNHIFPKVPQPRDLLTDISDNNNKSAVYNLYVATEEDVNCKITLVTEPHINTPDC